MFPLEFGITSPLKALFFECLNIKTELFFGKNRKGTRPAAIQAR